MLVVGYGGGMFTTSFLFFALLDAAGRSPGRRATPRVPSRPTRNQSEEKHHAQAREYPRRQA